MGRPKKGEKKPASTSSPDERVAIIHLKGTPQYAAWLDAANKKTRIPKAALFRMGLEMVAKAYDLEPPPEA